MILSNTKLFKCFVGYNHKKPPFKVDQSSNAFRSSEDVFDVIDGQLSCLRCHAEAIPDSLPSYLQKDFLSKGASSATNKR